MSIQNTCETCAQSAVGCSKCCMRVARREDGTIQARHRACLLVAIEENALVSLVDFSQFLVP